MISNSGTTSLGLYDFKRQIDAFGGVDYFRPTLAGGYLPNARVMLNNGDIVKNDTVGNLTNDPNLDMTGWKNTNDADQIKYITGVDAQTVKDRFVYIQDFGGSYNDFDPSVSEAAAKAEANPNSKPYDGARQYTFPMRTIKAWNYLDGFLDRGAVASFRNVDAFDSPEPRTEILGIANAAGLGDYSDRDVAGLFVQVEGQPTLHTSTATVFTATTVTCSDMTSRVKGFLRKNQIIDVVDGGMTYSGLIQSVLGDVITVDTAWYKTDGSNTTGTPSNGSQIKIVPNTKIWATNFNAMLTEQSDATQMVGIELGMFNNKVGAGGYGFDMWSGGTYQIGAAFQARGNYHTGLSLQNAPNFGVVVYDATENAFYAAGGNYAFFSQNSNISILAKSPTSYSFLQTKADNSFVTGVNKDGSWEGLRYKSAVIAIGETIGQYSTMNFVSPTAAGQVINLPSESQNPERVMFIKNLSPTNLVYLAGNVEGGSGSYQLQAKETVQMFCDGSTWYPISRHQG